MRLCLLCLSIALPILANSQVSLPVMPVESNDYLKLIRRDSIATSPSDSSQAAARRLYSPYYFDNELRVRSIQENGFRIRLRVQKEKTLAINGGYTMYWQQRTAVRQPALQRSFAQGRSQNGQLVWRGPDSNELFSYGPALPDLEYDGSSYPYDANGALVPAGTGNGLPANAYRNKVLRKASQLGHQFYLQSSYRENYQERVSSRITFGSEEEQQLIRTAKNETRNFSAEVSTLGTAFTVSAAYRYLGRTNQPSNFMGLLNRVYQNALLTPASFDNSQGPLIGNTQRSYSALADNPWYLLSRGTNSADSRDQTIHLKMQYRSYPHELSLSQSLLLSRLNNILGFPNGAAGLPTGLVTGRKQNDHAYHLNALAIVELDPADFRARLQLGYHLTRQGTDIRYSLLPNGYRYRRTTQQVETNIKANHFYLRDGRLELNVGNSMYFSSTSTKSAVFLPRASAIVNWYNVGQNGSLTLAATLSNSATEPDITQSYSSLALLGYQAGQTNSYFPLNELRSYGGLRASRHRDATLSVSYYLGSRWNFAAEYFSRKFSRDIFPYVDAGQIMLANMATHRSNGWQLSVGLQSKYPYTSKRFRYSTNIQLLKWNSLVTSTEPGFNGTAVAGFNNVYKTIQTGQPLGVIVGTRYRRNDQGQLIIGADGFPLVDPQPAILGNTIPRFTASLNQQFNWKGFSLQLDWEWRNGGRAWNGTAAMLDYYGRSLKTAQQRNLQNYIFPGVSENNQPNTIPVDFYDPALPVTSNRWTRYSLGGLTEDYVQRTDQVAIRSLQLSKRIVFKKIFQEISLSAYLHNWIIWSAYRGGDPVSQLMMEQPNSSGLDYFNLPLTRTMGLQLSIQF